MIITDTHCDTLCKILDGGKDLKWNELDVNIDKMKVYSQYTQVFACFIDPIYKSNAKNRCLKLIDMFYKQAEKFNIVPCVGINDILYARNRGEVAGLLSIEGGECIESLSDLRIYSRLGVKIAALTWNYQNHIAGGVLGDSSAGLTVFGREVVKEMNRINMAVDVSHLNEKSFWDVIELSEKPVIASHSDSKSICSHPRNLTDRQFKSICKSGGYVGINFYPVFLNDSMEAGINDIVKHIEHFMKLGGEEHIGIGADFDGVDYLPDGINGPAEIYRIFDRLIQLGYNEDLVKKLSYSNFDRFISEF